MWDFVLVIETSVQDWIKTSWMKLNIEVLDQKCKNFTKDLRTLDKNLRNWAPYIYAEDIIKNLMTSLRAVTELQNPAIQDRHWQELMDTTKVRFSMDESTTLSDLLNLNLHEHEETVKDIVEKSVKEGAMGKSLKEIEAYWATVEFEYDRHDRTNTKILRQSEELIEVLEENQVQIQNMVSNKYVDFYLDKVLEWQAKLSNADQVINSWFELQRKWVYLESIFIGSEDIRKQLPDHSKRFDTVDRSFKEILRDFEANPNVVKATNKPGLYETLERLQADLIICEKALNDYLETKRMIYPRFYFVSSADLLDILSNGNNPPMVARHLTKLYDSLAKLQFESSSSKNAKEMISKENEEHVKFKKPCDCSGKVEIWLNRLTDLMRETLHDIFEKAVIAYETKPREQVISDFPAQPALCTTQIWWTTEVNEAFGRVEEGHENALKDYNRKQVSQLNSLINLLLADLTAGDRQKIMTVCTIDVHSRDVVSKMVAMKIDSKTSFQWQSQLRHRWDKVVNDCYANICDAQFK